MIKNIRNLINIEKKEVLRYLQYKNQEINEDLNFIIEKSIYLTKEIINPRYIYKVCNIDTEKIKYDDNIVYLRDEKIKFESNDLYNLLINCEECILVSATLGLEIEREIRKLTYTNLTKGVIVDACATTAIEEVCDKLQEYIEKDLLKEGKYITMRYSPGYGDLSIEKNKDIINILNSQNRIGLTVSESGIMIPRKSVVAIIGISSKGTDKTKKSCKNCSNRDNCRFKKGDDSYED
ncbi:MAG: vitamin B12 dependent-methionine synthase activation domain-containing protein [Terrisporobacter sp.]|uniref:vitamin B12 dependent-methionine synthase activation domain-containing protein n=1 Tax=Terrisporobacter sp. TaxID=1965305 RepID=UPI002FC68D33